MAMVPIYNPPVPYVGLIQGGFSPGEMVRIQGNIPPTAQRFAVNLQCGPNVNPRDDIALHVSPRFNEGFVARTSLKAQSWGPEENHGSIPVMQGQGFELIILCDPSHYKIAFNGQHFTEFDHRLPYQSVTHLTIDGDVTISMIQYEGGSGSVPGGPAANGLGFVPPPPLPTDSYVPPPMSAPPMAAGPYAPPAAPYATSPIQSPYPSQPYGYGPPPPVPGYGYQPAGYGPPPPPGSAYPPPPPGYQQQYPYGTQQKSEKGLGGILGKAGAAVAGALGTAGVLGALGSKSHGGYPHKSSGHGMGGMAGLGGLGTVLGAGLAGSALTGMSPKKALKANKKSHNKALKYGIPAAGLGLGAYALHRGFGHGSSSSSSSSEEE